MISPENAGHQADHGRGNFGPPPTLVVVSKNPPKPISYRNTSGAGQVKHGPVPTLAAGSHG